MGTRGAYGFRYKDQDYLSYNQFDSYPDGLGVAMVQNVRALLGIYGVEGLRERVKNLRMVNPDNTPTPKERTQYQAFRRDVSSGNDWYAYLRGIQGDIAANIEHGIMLNNPNFVLDSLFCEWAYIVNLDTLMLEVYTGFQTKNHTRGRYAAPKSADWTPQYEGQKYYYPVKLIAEFPLTDIPDNFVTLVSPGKVLRKNAGKKRKTTTV